MAVEVLVEPDDRGRVSLSKLPGANAERYIGQRMADGSIVLRPAVVLSYKALQSLVKVQAVHDRDGRRPGKPLRDVLAERDRGTPSDAQVEAANAEIAHRRAGGARFLSDLTPDELATLRAGHAGWPGTQ